MIAPSRSAASECSQEILLASDLETVWHPFQPISHYATNQIVLTRGDGAYLFDSAGRKYLDSVSGLWNMNLGYSEARIVEAITAQLSTLPFASLFSASHEPAINLAQRLGEQAPEDLNTLLFATGGAEAIETAIKLARHIAALSGEVHRRKIIALRDSYHGTSYGALSITGISGDRWQFGALLPEVAHVRSPRGLPLDQDTTRLCLDDLKAVLAFEMPSTIAAIVIEPVMGVAGMIPQPPGYLAELRQLCDRYGILLIFDEVSCGCGRTGRFFAADRFGVTPDMIVMSKALSGGYFPLAAVLARRKYLDLCAHAPGGAFMHGYTYGGAPAGCAAALCYLDILKNSGLVEEVDRNGAYFLSLLKERLAGQDHVTGVHGIGLAASARVIDPESGTSLPAAIGSSIVRYGRERGVLLRSSYDGATFNFMPPFICTRLQLEEIVEVFSCAIKACIPAHSQG